MTDREDLTVCGIGVCLQCAPGQVPQVAPAEPCDALQLPAAAVHNRHGRRAGHHQPRPLPQEQPPLVLVGSRHKGHMAAVGVLQHPLHLSRLRHLP